MVGCPVFKKPKLTAVNMLGRSGVSDRVLRTDAEQQNATARLQREVKDYKKQPVSRSIAVFSGRNRGERRGRAASNGSGSGGASPAKLERKCKRKE